MVNKVNVLKVAKAFAEQSLAKERGIGYNQEHYYTHAFGNDYSGNGCGTTMCVAGWAVALLRPEQKGWLGLINKGANFHMRNLHEEAVELLGLNDDQARRLFGGTANPQQYDHRLATCTVAACLKNLAETDEVDWFKAESEAKKANG